MKNKARTPELELSLLTLLRRRADYSLMCRQYDTTGERACQENFEDEPAVVGASPAPWQ